MKKEVLERLRIADRSNLDAPQGFEFESAVARVSSLVPALETIVGRPLTFESSNPCSLRGKDGDLLERVCVFAVVRAVHEERVEPKKREAVQEGTRIWPLLELRFSSFGRLFTCESSSVAPGALSEDVVVAVLHAVRAQGFAYMDPHDLEDTYFGKNAELHGKVSWFHRFFADEAG